MNAIYAYKEFPKHYKSLNRKFYEVAKLSVMSAKKYYKTILYCDSNINKKFIDNGLFFDEVVILDKIKNYNGNLYCIPKILAMMEQKEPYIMLDFDSILLEKITSSHTITYGFYEVNFENNPNDDEIEWYHQAYLQPFRTHLKEYFSADELMKFNWTKVPNFSFFMVNNPFVINHIFQTIIKKIPLRVMENCTATLIEQFLCYQYIKILDIDDGVIIKNMYPFDYNIYSNEFRIEHFLFKKYIHLDINHTKIKNIVDSLKEYFQK